MQPQVPLVPTPVPGPRSFVPWHNAQGMNIVRMPERWPLDYRGQEMRGPNEKLMQWTQNQREAIAKGRHQILQADTFNGGNNGGATPNQGTIIFPNTMSKCYKNPTRSSDHIRTPHVVPQHQSGHNVHLQNLSQTGAVPVPANMQSNHQQPNMGQSPHDIQNQVSMANSQQQQFYHITHSQHQHGGNYFQPPIPIDSRNIGLRTMPAGPPIFAVQPNVCSLQPNVQYTTPVHQPRASYQYPQMQQHHSMMNPPQPTFYSQPSHQYASVTQNQISQPQSVVMNRSNETKRKKKIIPIIDPETNKHIQMSTSQEKNDNSPPQSINSSERTTPELSGAPPSTAAAEFASKITRAAIDTGSDLNMEGQVSSHIQPNEAESSSTENNYPDKIQQQYEETHYENSNNVQSITEECKYDSEAVLPDSVNDKPLIQKTQEEISQEAKRKISTSSNDSTKEFSSKPKVEIHLSSEQTKVEAKNIKNKKEHDNKDKASVKQSEVKPQVKSVQKNEKKTQKKSKDEVKNIPQQVLPVPQAEAIQFGNIVPSEIENTAIEVTVSTSRPANKRRKNHSPSSQPVPANINPSSSQPVGNTLSFKQPESVEKKEKNMQENEAKKSSRKKKKRSGKGSSQIREKQNQTAKDEISPSTNKNIEIKESVPVATSPELPDKVPSTPVEVPKEPVSIQPEMMTSVPVEQPVAPIEQPVAPIEQPVAPVEQPVAPVVQPVAPVVQPVAPVELPVAPVELPVAPVEQPVAPVEQPVAPEPPVVSSPDVPTQQVVVQETVIESSPALPSEEPQDENKRLTYDRNFILDRQRTIMALVRPNLPDLEVVRPEPHSNAYEHSLEARMINTDFYGSRNSGFSQRGLPNMGGGRKKRNDNQKVISLTGDATLRHTSENAYTLHKSQNIHSNLDGDDARRLHLKRSTRAFLNKLTPDNFRNILPNLHSNIKTLEDIQIVIDEIYEKALGESVFSHMYSDLCVDIHGLNMRANRSTEKGMDSSDKFRVIMVSKCQKEFEKESEKIINHAEWQEKIAKAEESNDKQKVEELKVLYEMEKDKVRKRKVALVKFIGELFNRKMLYAKTMMTVAESLMQNNNDEKLESLCKLIETIGEVYESETANYQPFKLNKDGKEEPTEKTRWNNLFRMLQSLTTKQGPPLTKRIKFLIMDVIDLRKRNWDERRKKEKPKTLDELHAEIEKENEQKEREIRENDMNDNLNRNYSRRDDNYRDDRRGGGGGGRRDTRDGDQAWHTATTNRQRQAFDILKLRQATTRDKQSSTNLFLGPESFRWGSGSNSRNSVSKESPASSSSNRFNALSNMEKPKPNVGPRLSNMMPAPKSSYGSKSMPPPSNNGSPVHINRNRPPIDRSKSSSRNASRDGPEVKKVEPTFDEAREQIMKSVKVFTSSNSETDSLASQNAKDYIRNTLRPFKLESWFLRAAFEWLLEEKEQAQMAFTQFLKECLTEQLLCDNDIVEGCAEVIEAIVDLKVDVPLIFSSLGKMFGALYASTTLSFNSIVDLLRPTEHDRAELLCSILKETVIFLDIAQPGTGEEEAINLMQNVFNRENLGDIFKTERDSRFLENLGFPRLKKFIDSIAAADESSNVEEDRGNLVDKFKQLFKQENSNKNILDLIDEQGDFDKSTLVRIIVTGLIESILITVNPGDMAVLPPELVDLASEKAGVLQRIVDGNSELELQCIYALQVISAKYQHPQGLLKHCFNILYQSDVVSEEVFFLWADLDNADAEEQSSRGVCVPSVKAWIEFLKNSEPES